MNTVNALIGLGVMTAVVVAVVALASSVLRERRQRARRRHYDQVNAQSPRASAPSPLSTSMTPEHSAAIRAHAERTARRHWQAGTTTATPLNPYDSGTAENVLWYATYQLVVHELGESSAPPRSAAMRASRGAGNSLV